MKALGAEIIVFIAVADRLEMLRKLLRSGTEGSLQQCLTGAIWHVRIQYQTTFESAMVETSDI